MQPKLVFNVTPAGAIAKDMRHTIHRRSLLFSTVAAAAFIADRPAWSASGFTTATPDTAPSGGQLGSFVVNTYSSSNGLGHVDITFYALPNGAGNLLGTYGLNVHGFPNGNGATQGGWFQEDNFEKSAALNGTLQYQSPPHNVLLSIINNTNSTLLGYARSNGQLGSPGYWLWGDNCVDGVSTALKMLDVDANTRDYMKPSTLAVYAYASATATSIRIPTPNGGVNVETSLYKVLVDSTANLAEYFLQGGSAIISWFNSIVAAQSQQDDGTPVQIDAGQIVITLNPTSHVATVTYDSPNLMIYDDNGNYVASGEEYGLPSEFLDAVSADLAAMQAYYPED